MKARHVALIVTLLGALVAACAAQSQPEQQPQPSNSATQSEQKPGEQTETPAPKPKAKRVFTNDDIPSSPDADKPSSNSSSEPAVAVPTAKVSANDMREIVRRQKARLSTATSNRDKLQALMEKLPHSDCRNLYYPDDPKKDVCTDVAKIPGKLKQAQSQVDKEQSTLEQLQARAKQMGYGSSVYDPD